MRRSPASRRQTGNGAEALKAAGADWGQLAGSGGQMGKGAEALKEPEVRRSPASRVRTGRRRDGAGRATVGAAVGALVVSALAVGAWLAAAAVAAQASAGGGGPLYHHPDHDELPDTTFVPQSDVTEADGADEAEVGDLPPGAGRIIGSPDPGPEPQHSGDRGGWRQLALLGALAAAVAAIMVRILLAARRQQDRAEPDQPQRAAGAATSAET